MYYNIDISYPIMGAMKTIRKVTKVKQENLTKYIELYSTEYNQIIITQYHQ